MCTENLTFCLPYVEKFLIQKLGDGEAAYEMLVGALKWRKTFGVHDLKYQELDQSMLDIGLAYNHGEDKEQNTIVILNCHLHKKDPKKLPDLQKLFVFALESHARKFPYKKVTLIFNMSQCGLSNMDMEFVKVIINCFKFYFPNMLGYMLVFEMSWLLQAAWKIIKSWLSEAAVRKIKFVTKSDITDYISPSQLLTMFGGVDDWTFDAVTFKEELRKEHDSVWLRDPLGVSPDEGIEVEEEEEEDGEGEGLKESDPGPRQVRFASGQSPTRQSRYGTDEDAEYYSQRSTSSLEPQLLRGTASSPGYRRRQVTKLINSSQLSPEHSWPRSTSSIDYGDLPSYRKSPSYVHISPVEELHFCGEPDKDLFSTLQLSNVSDQPLAYKIKTTAPQRYKVRPNINTIDPHSKAVVQVQLVKGAGLDTKSITQDKFLIQTYQFDSGATPPSTAQLSLFWKELGPSSVQEYRLLCRYSLNTIKEEIPTSKPLPTPSSNQEQIKKDISPMAIRKLDRLSTEINELRNTLNYVKYIAMVTLLLVLFTLAVLLLK